MIILANMKRLQEDIDEAVTGLLGAGAEGLYRDWIEQYAEPHVKKWLEEHNYDVNSCNTFEYVRYIADKFIDWISGNK
jgi:thiaminase